MFHVGQYVTVAMFLLAAACAERGRPQPTEPPTGQALQQPCLETSDTFQGIIDEEYVANGYVRNCGNEGLFVEPRLVETLPWGKKDMYAGALYDSLSYGNPAGKPTFLIDSGRTKAFFVSAPFHAGSKYELSMAVGR